MTVSDSHSECDNSQGSQAKTASQAGQHFKRSYRRGFLPMANLVYEI